MPFPVHIIGTGMSLTDLTAAHNKMIDEADVIFASTRTVEDLSLQSRKIRPIDKNLSIITDYIRKNGATENIVVLASGDPLFFGIGSYISFNIGAERVRIHPNVSSLAAAFSRMNLSWANVPVLSLHGRDADTGKIIKEIEEKQHLFLLTDSLNTPQRIAGSLLSEGMEHVSIGIFEYLGYPSEKVQWMSLEMAAGQIFKEPNVVVLRRGEIRKVSASPLFLGMPDSAYAHEKGLITKSEIRVIAISKLKLESHHILWDLGAGSGSLGIEASLFIQSGSVISVEKSERRIEQIRQNMKRFDVRNLSLHQMDLPRGMETLPAPHRIFVGGGGRNLPGILSKAIDALKPNGRMVVHTILLETLESARSIFKAHLTEIETIQVQIQKSRPMPYGERLSALNPVWILSGEKK